MAGAIAVIESAAIEVRGASRHFGAVRAVDGVDLSVRRGEIFGLIGHNGAGKSTLFKMMLGLVEPSSGEVFVDGCAVHGRDFRAVRRRIGYLPENVALYDNLSGLETLRFFASLKGAARAQCEPLLQRVGLAAAARRPLREYSKGMRQRLGLAQALLGDPRVLFLDEPGNGLDPQAIRDLYALLDELRAQGVTVLITSHILAELQERVDRLAIMANGRIVASGSVDELRAQVPMPLTISARLGAADALSAQQQLAALAGVDVIVEAEVLRVHCPRPHKMAVLAVLAGFGAGLRDLGIREPSLEDVFFGLSNQDLA